MIWKKTIDLNNLTKVLKWKVLNSKCFGCFWKDRVLGKICDILTKGIWLKNDRLSFEKKSFNNDPRTWVHVLWGKKVLMMTLELEFMFCEYKMDHWADANSFEIALYGW